MPPWTARARGDDHLRGAKEARNRLEALKAARGKQLPEAMECLDGGFAAATQFYAFPKAHWRRIKTTNGLEAPKRVGSPLIERFPEVHDGYAIAWAWTTRRAEI